MLSDTSDNYRSSATDQQNRQLFSTRYDEPHDITIEGQGRGGIRITVAMTVRGNDPGSTFHLSAELAGGLLNGPIGGLVARVVKSDVRKSVNNLAALE